MLPSSRHLLRGQRHQQLLRRFLSNESILKNKSANADYTPDNFSVPVPWGEITGQSWGNGPTTVLAVHGWLDNCATFDRLFRLLPLDKLRLVAVDLPGHGLSGHIPPGMNYTMTDGLVVLTRAQDLLGLDKCAILGHSMGAGIGALFAAAFPERVTRLAMLDLIGFGAVPLKKHARMTGKSVKMAIKYNDMLEESRRNPEKIPKYEKLDAIARAFMANTLIHGADSITKESVEHLMSRGLKKVETTAEGKELYTWTSDLRIRIPSAFNLTVDQVDHYASKIDVPHLVIKASDSPLYMSEDAAERLLGVYRNNNPDFEWREVAGGHHVHLNDPEKEVGAIVEEFLTREFKNKGTEDKENAPFKL